MNIKVSPLEPKYSSQKSFYSKALVLSYDYGLNHISILKSYDTDVVKITCKNDEATVNLHSYYSYTTNKHITEFFLQYFNPVYVNYIYQVVRQTWIDRGYKLKDYRPSLSWFLDHVDQFTINMNTSHMSNIIFVKN